MARLIGRGWTVRTFDFPMVSRKTEGPMANFAEGTVEDVVQIEGGEYYKIKVQKLVQQGVGVHLEVAEAAGRIEDGYIYTDTQSDAVDRLREPGV